MARTALEQAVPADRIDDVFETHRHSQYARKLLFSTIVESMTLVALGPRPPLHAASRQMESLPVSLTALYDKVDRTEPEILEALVRGSAERLAPAMTGLGQGEVLTGWTVRVLDRPTESGDTTIRLWSNLPSGVDARQIGGAHRRRWSVEGLFGRLESVLRSEILSLGQPRAALLAFAVSVLAYDVLALIARCIERAPEPAPEVPFFHLVVQIRSGYEGMTIALPPGHWAEPGKTASELTDRLLRPARRVRPKSLAVSKRARKAEKLKGDVDGATARAHVATPA